MTNEKNYYMLPYKKYVRSGGLGEGLYTLIMTIRVRNKTWRKLCINRHNETFKRITLLKIFTY